MKARRPGAMQKKGKLEKVDDAAVGETKAVKTVVKKLVKAVKVVIIVIVVKVVKVVRGGKANNHVIFSESEKNNFNYFYFLLNQ